MGTFLALWLLLIAVIILGFLLNEPAMMVVLVGLLALLIGWKVVTDSKKGG